MIEFSCHTWAFSDLTLQEALGTAARLGFRYVDIGSGAHINTARVAQDTRRFAAELLNDLHTYNLKIADVYLMLPHIADPDADKRQRDLQSFNALLPFLRAIRAPGVTLSPGIVPTPDDAALERARDSLRAMVAAAGNLAVSIEPHLDSVADSPAAALELVNAVDGLQITLDWAHMVCKGVKPADIIRMLPHTRHVQVRQAARNRLQTPFERGKLDLGAFMVALKDARYDRIVSIEYMKTPNWHGAMTVNTLHESVLLRDALRTLRDQ